ncbi:MAG TPA: hypothetical protein VGL58_17905 [Caulobacteraceae bacterium]
MVVASEDIGRKAAGEETSVARIAARLSSEYVLRVLKLIADLHDGDILAAIITQAIIGANTAHLDTRDGDGARFAGAPPPDELRRPISVLALSRSLGMPFETTRRYVSRLVESGRAQRVKGGVIVPASVLHDPISGQAAETNLLYLRRLCRNLAAAGVAVT